MIIEIMTIEGHIPVHHEDVRTQEVEVALVQEEEDHIRGGNNLILILIYKS